MSAALVRCAQLRHPYRGSPRLSEALDLLKLNDYHELLQRRSKLIAGKPCGGNHPVFQCSS